MDLFSNMEMQGVNPLSLLELNGLVQQVIHSAFSDTYWLCAETSDVRTNASSGHCYLEFIEKDEFTNKVVAKARGNIWARTFNILRAYFEKETGQSFRSGLKVLVKVSVEFNELYGYSLMVQDIEPSYTLGDLVKKRQEIVRQLQQEGIFDMNRELTLNDLPKKIALITSATAAGYEDFINHLENNKWGYAFCVKLFPAIMQGERTEESIIAALDQIYPYAKHFDAVVIIRGGGASSDLSCFDSYALAANCAQFPLPIITGIGHERDDSIVDMVAHTRMKTPTAVADFLVSRFDTQSEILAQMEQTLYASATDLIQNQNAQLKLLAARFPSLVLQRIERQRSQLQTIGSELAKASAFINHCQANLQLTKQSLQNLVTNLLTEKKRQLEITSQYIEMASPDYILKRGYSLTLQNGKIIKHASELKLSEEYTFRYADGERTGKIIK